MKKMKILPLILTLPLLVGCNKEDIKPKFAKEGEKIEFNAFNDAFQEDMKKSAFFSEDESTYIPSFKAVAEMDQLEKQTLKRDGKENASTTTLGKSKANAASDSENGILRAKISTDREVTRVTPEGKDVEKGKANQTNVIQKATIEDKTYMVEVDVEAKTYELAETIDEEHPYYKYYKERISETIGMPFMMLMLVEMSYSAASEEDQKNYGFYKNGQIYTAEFSHEEVKETKDAEENVTQVETDKTYVKVQLDFKKADVMKAAFYQEEVKSIEYKVSSSVNYAGDIVEDIEKSAYSCDIKKADVKNKAEDLSKYAKID